MATTRSPDSRARGRRHGVVDLRDGAARPRRLWLRAGCLVVLLLLAVPAVAVVAVLRAAQVHDDRPTDAIVVLGAAQFDGRPSPVFASRLAHAAQLYRDGLAKTIVTVGGKQSGDRFTEAAAGRDWLMDNGIPSSALVAVGSGSDTWESLRAFAAVADGRTWSSITVVTDPAHAARSIAMVSALGFDAHANAKESGDGSVLTPEYVMREAAGWLWFNTYLRWTGSSRA